jgi:hypothetical protein
MKQVLKISHSLRGLHHLLPEKKMQNELVILNIIKLEWKMIMSKSVEACCHSQNLLSS